MELPVQIKSIIMSFLYGILYSVNFNLFYNLLFTKYKMINIITNFFFNIISFGIYFLLLYIINQGVVHLYFLVSFLLGFLIYNKIFVKLQVKWQKIKF